jgi:poly-gamma-glutamate capsule biosynthesis protein CapA/YwtB (metallophosphatase superfamily)
MVNKDEVLMYAVGDVGPDRDDPKSIFLHVSDLLKTGDMVFCQLEPPLSHTTRPELLAKKISNDSRLVAAALKASGIDIYSFASNHCMEKGEASFLETIDCLKREGVHVIGVGNNIEEARRPAIIECKGKRIAFLAYNSVGIPATWAQANKPGCAPLRAFAFFEPVEALQPGTPAKPRTFPYRDDLSAMLADVRNAKSQADVVVVSMHSGVHMTPVVVAEYQVDIAHAAVDAGADLILQHHAHILKGIEVYRGKVIFYGLGNFAIEVHFMNRAWAEIPAVKEQRNALNPDWNPPYADYPSFPFPPDSRKTLVVKYVMSGKSISRVSFLPVYINGRSQPEILKPDNSRFREVIDYVEKITQEAGFNTSFKLDGAEVSIVT